jgi:hypothetical protein
MGVKRQFILTVSLLLLVFFGCGSRANAEKPLYGFMAPPPPPNKSFGHPTPNLKWIPALMYSTLGAEFEYPVDKLSFGGVAMWKYGNGLGASNKTTRPEEYQEFGYRIEGFGRYYFKGFAPIGFFAEVKIYYNTIMYYDGNPIPFTLYTQGRAEVNGQPAEIRKPKPIGGGLGGGFQATIVPKILIASVKLGLEFNQDSYDNFLISLYFQPAIGYIF